MSLAITTTALSLSATKGNLAQLAASGATGQVAWSLVQPSVLPGGLFMSADGRITGTPGITGTFPVVVSAYDLGPVGTLPGGGSSQANSQPTPPGPAVGATVTLTIS